jgi:transglutaminase-like putative cysteine protease
VLIAMCRHRGVAARYVSGHLIGEGASHAWVEVCDRPSGRVLALDPTHDRATDLRYLTVAVGRDYGDVAPTRGTAWSGGGPGQLGIDKTFRIVAVA